MKQMKRSRIILAIVVLVVIAVAVAAVPLWRVVSSAVFPSYAVDMTKPYEDCILDKTSKLNHVEYLVDASTGDTQQLGICIRQDNLYTADNGRLSPLTITKPRIADLPGG